MKFTKNKKRIDPRYFLNETVEEEKPVNTVEEGLMADLFAKMKAKPAEESEEDLASRYLKSVQPHMKGSPDISVTHNPEYAKHFASDLYKEDLSEAAMLEEAGLAYVDPDWDDSTAASRVGYTLERLPVDIAKVIKNVMRPIHDPAAQPGEVAQNKQHALDELHRVLKYLDKVMPEKTGPQLRADLEELGVI